MSDKRARKVVRRLAKKLRKVKRRLVFGVLDTRDNLWLGDDNGPRKFTDLALAQVAAQINDVRLGWAPGRSRAMLFTSAPKKVDEIKPKMTTLEAMQRIEDGHAV